MSVMIGHGVQKGYGKFVLSVQQDNPAAIHMYKKLGFKVVNQSFQYIIDMVVLAINSKNEQPTGNFQVIPIGDCASTELPKSMDKWYKAHHNPDNQVLVFKQNDLGFVGFCRFNPEFPGCSPFEIWKSDVSVDALLLLLDDYLSADKKKLKLTFANVGLAETLEASGHILNYKLYEMLLDRREA